MYVLVYVFAGTSVVLFVTYFYRMLALLQNNWAQNCICHKERPLTADSSKTAAFHGMNV